MSSAESFERYEVFLQRMHDLLSQARANESTFCLTKEDLDSVAGTIVGVVVDGDRLRQHCSRIFTMYPDLDDPLDIIAPNEWTLVLLEGVENLSHACLLQLLFAPSLLAVLWARILRSPSDYWVHFSLVRGLAQKYVRQNHPSN